MPKVSIIVPIYNVEQYLSKCLDSLVNQTLKDIEIICVIDNSPDNSIEICKKFQANDDRIIIIDKPVNEGLGLTRNVGIEEAKGEYVAFCDSDDFVDIHMYEKLYDFAQEYDLDVAYCNYVRYTDGKIIKSNQPQESIINDTEEKNRNFMLDMIGPLPSYPSDVKYLISACFAIYSNKIIKNRHIRFESERKVTSEDTLFNLHFLIDASKSGYIPFEGYYYRYNNMSLSRNHSREKTERLKFLLKIIYQILQNKIPEELFILHYQRFVFFIFRISIKYESIQSTGKKRYCNVKKNCEDLMMKELYRTYPYRKLPLPKKIFFFCMKHKLVYPLIIISKMDNKRNKVI